MAGLQQRPLTERLRVQFPVRVHSLLVGLILAHAGTIPGLVHVGGNQSVSLSSSLSKSNEKMSLGKDLKNADCSTSILK